MEIKTNKLDRNLKILRLILISVSILWVISQLSSTLLPILLFILEKFSPIVIGIIIAFLLNPLVEWINSKLLINNKRLAIGITISFLIILIVFIVYPIFLSIMNNFPYISTYIQYLVNKIINTDYINDETKNTILLEFNKYNSLIMQNMLGIINNFLTISMNSIISVIIVIFTLLEYDSLKCKTLNIFNTNDNKHAIEYISGLEREILYYLKSMSISLLLLLVVFVLALFITNVDNALSFGFIISSLIVLIPIIGPLIATIILSLILLYNVSIVNIIVLFILIIFIQLFINIISPKIYAQTLNVSNLLVIITFFAGNAFFGLLGGILALPTLIFIKYTLNFIKSAKKIENGEIINES